MPIYTPKYGILVDKIGRCSIALGLVLRRTATKNPMAMTMRTTATSFFDTTTNLWSNASLSGRGG
jgi:hypothetical protein